MPPGFDPKTLAYVAMAILVAIGLLFMRNTHPYKGSQREPFESKQKRRRIGVGLIVTAIMILGITILTQILISRN